MYVYSITHLCAALVFRDGYMFWSDVIAKHIVRTKMDGTLLTILVQTDITTPGTTILYVTDHSITFL